MQPIPTEAITWLRERAEWHDKRAVEQSARKEYCEALSSSAMSAAYAYAAREFEKWRKVST